MTPFIFDMQRFSIHDGPGIRTVIFFKGCNLECPWCQNPESISFKPEIAFYSDKCVNSFECITTCDAGAIYYENGIQINREACTHCGKCEDACVSGAIKIIGKEYSADYVMNEILRDVDYYNESGGGVTFSGGEPTLHFEFLLELLKMCKRLAIHTNIETNGYFSLEKFEQLLPYLNLIYFDLKIIEESKNKLILSGDSKRILRNLKRLIELNAPVEVRLPLIPVFTANEKNLDAVIEILKADGVHKIHLLPYHSMGESKAEKIGGILPPLNLIPFHTEELQEIAGKFENENIETVLYR